MYIIAGQDQAERLKENYTVLELETFERDGQPIPTFCVVAADAIPLLELPDLERYKQLHAEFIVEYRQGNYKFCEDLVEHLYGRFGGELDSFYDTILGRIRSSRQ